MTRYQLRAIRRAAASNARLLTGRSHSLTTFHTLLDDCLAEFRIGSGTPAEIRLLAVIEHYADSLIERSA
jgi:hypothetical protein